MTEPEFGPDDYRDAILSTVDPTGEGDHAVDA